MLRKEAFILLCFPRRTPSSPAAAGPAGVSLLPAVPYLQRGALRALVLKHLQLARQRQVGQHGLHGPRRAGVPADTQGQPGGRSTGAGQLVSP